MVIVWMFYKVCRLVDCLNTRDVCSRFSFTTLLQLSVCEWCVVLSQEIEASVWERLKIRQHPTFSQLNRVFLYLTFALMSLVTFPLLPLIAENVLFMVVQDLCRDIFDVFWVIKGVTYYLYMWYVTCCFTWKLGIHCDLLTSLAAC